MLEPSCSFGGRRGTAPEAVDNGRGSTENGVAMKTLEALRDQTLHKLASHYAVGDLRLAALTVSRSPARFGDGLFARLFPAATVATDIFTAVAPPAGPVIERTAGAPWPGGSFAAAAA